MKLECPLFCVNSPHNCSNQALTCALYVHIMYLKKGG